MPARIEFDYARAIDRATQLFWKKGYRDTSLRDLLKTMGIGEGSFYNTFKSKRRLYLECLKHYNRTVSRRRLDALAAPASVKAGIRAFFHFLLDELDNPKIPSVCMLAGSVSGEVLRERELAATVTRDMQAFGDAFKKRLEEGKHSGELPANYDAEQAASVIMTFLMGLFRMIRVLNTRAEMEAQVEVLLRGLGL
jgi:TetR/AcrR family transcriptional regulator, transcriptional repressor for nem operon